MIEAGGGLLNRPTRYRLKGPGPESLDERTVNISCWKVDQMTTKRYKMTRKRSKTITRTTKTRTTTTKRHKMTTTRCIMPDRHCGIFVSLSVWRSCSSVGGVRVGRAFYMSVSRGSLSHNLSMVVGI